MEIENYEDEIAEDINLDSDLSEVENLDVWDSSDEECHSSRSRIRGFARNPFLDEDELQSDEEKAEELVSHALEYGPDEKDESEEEEEWEAEEDLRRDEEGENEEEEEWEETEENKLRPFDLKCPDFTMDSVEEEWMSWEIQQLQQVENEVDEQQVAIRSFAWTENPEVESPSTSTGNEVDRPSTSAGNEVDRPSTSAGNEVDRPCTSASSAAAARRPRSKKTAPRRAPNVQACQPRQKKKKISKSAEARLRRQRREAMVWQPMRRTPPVTTFSGPVGGPTSEAVLGEEASPLDYFQLIFGNDILDLLVVETNRYASQYIASTTLGPRSRAREWKPCSKDEMKVFLGLSLLTGVIYKRGPVADYWSTDPFLATPIFGKCMGRNRFQLLSRFLHFVNNENMPDPSDVNRDRLFKIRPLYEMLLVRWRALYNPGEFISIDEAMLKWRGRLSFRVYCKDKPIKYGIKSYVLADSSSFYCWNMDMYHRQEKTLKDIVMGLLTPARMNRWHSLYMDNLYNSVELSETLLAQQVHTVGTLRRDRGAPPEVNDCTLASLPQNGIISKDNGNVMVLAWKDKRIVRMVSTKHNASTQRVRRRKRGVPRGMEEVLKPACVVDYNKYMSGVDHLDQMTSYYPCTRKTVKWSKKVFFYLMGISIFNCYVLYKAENRSRYFTMRQFLLRLIKQLCGHSPTIVSSTSPGDVALPARVPRLDPPGVKTGGFSTHRMQELPPTAKMAKPRRCCRQCKKRGLNKRTTTFCTKCKVPLCAKNCFHEYHLSS